MTNTIIQLATILVTNNMARRATVVLTATGTGELALSRRGFLATAAAGGAVLTGLSWTQLVRGSEHAIPKPPARKPLNVLPILVWDHARPAKMRSWRHWGGIQNPEQAAAEVSRIEGELDKIRQAADFPVEFHQVASVNNVKEMAESAALKQADVVVVYGAGIHIDGCQNFGKDVIIFQRHRSGPLYLQYEIVSPRFLRQHSDEPALDHITFEDVVTDSLEELTWRLRALCGLKNTCSSRIMCIGGPAGWGATGGRDPRISRAGLGNGSPNRPLRRTRQAH